MDLNIDNGDSLDLSFENEETSVNEINSTDIILSRDNFNNFLRILRMIENACNDVQIKDSKILQKTNDKYCIVKVDLSELFNGQYNFSLTKIKNKNQLFKILENNDNFESDENEEDNIHIKIDDKYCVFEDIISNLKFIKVQEKYLDNYYITDPKTIKALQCSEEDLLFEKSIPANLVKRIRSICDGFAMDHITCYVNHDKINFNISTLDKQNTSDVIKNMPLNRIEDKKYKFDIRSFAFTLEGNEVNIKIYKSIKSKVITYVFDQELFGVPITIIGRAEIILTK